MKSAYQQGKQVDAVLHRAGSNLEILNINELADLIDGAKYSRGHKVLLKILHRRYPAAVFHLVRRRRGVIWPGGVVSANDHVRIADSYESWMENAYDAAGRNVKTVWERHKDFGYLATEFQRELLYITMPFGAAADAFIQIEVCASREVASHPLLDFNPSSIPRDLEELLDPWWCRFENPIELTPWSYQRLNVTDVRRFIMKMAKAERQARFASIPDMKKQVVQVIYMDDDGQPIQEEVSYLDTLPANWLDAPKGEARMLLDWDACSAGRLGHRFCDHWSLDLYDNNDSDEKRRMGYTPLLSDRGLKLPVIETSRYKTDAALVERLEKFDRKAGYPMGWFFSMLHGAKLNHFVGKRVAHGLLSGQITLPIHDTEVILRWDDDPYGF